MRVRSLLLFSVLATLAATGCPHPRAIRDTVLAPPADRAKARAVREQVNAIRRERGLAALAPDEVLMRLALAHSRDMAARTRLTHRDRNGGLIQHRADSAGIDWRTIAENVGRNRGYDDPVAKAIAGWMESPGHRQSLLTSTFTRTGVGVVRGRDGYWYFTQVFLHPMPE